MGPFWLKFAAGEAITVIVVQKPCIVNQRTISALEPAMHPRENNFC